MNRFKKYYENTRHFQCPECGTHFSLSFWQWLWTMKFDFVRCRYVRCPYCKVRHWLTAERKVK